MNAQPTSRDDFEVWLASLDDFLEEFKSEVAAESRSRLDYSPSSLVVVEEWILAHFPDAAAVLAPHQIRRVTGVACYVGETFRKVLKWKWDIILDDPQFAFYGMPVIVSPKKESYECPLSLVSAAADRRTGNYLRLILEHLVSSQPTK